MTRRPSDILAVLAVLAALAGAQGRGAAQEPEIQGAPVVVPPSKVRGREHGAVTVRVATESIGLRADDFKLDISSGEGEPPVELGAVRVTPFRDTDQELELVILVEGNELFLGGVAASDTPAGLPPRSIAGDYDEVKQAIDIVAHARTKHTRVALVVYGDAVTVKAPFGPPEDLTGDALGPLSGYSGVKGRSLRLGLMRAREMLDGQPGRRVIFLIGDGADTDNYYAPRPDLAALESSSVELYALASSPLGLDAFQRSRVIMMSRLGGKLFVQRTQIPEAAGILRAEFNDDYTVEFPLPAAGAPQSPFDGRTHDVTVLVKGDASDPLSMILPAASAAPTARTTSKRGLWMSVTLVSLGCLALLLAFARRQRRRDAQPAVEAPVTGEAAAVPEVVPEAAAPRKTMALGAGSERVIPTVAWVVPLNGPARLHTFKLHAGMNFIGRGPHCEINVEDPLLSLHHAVIAVDANGFVLADAGSTNGVIISAERTQRHELNDNDTFVCGQTLFRFKAV